MAPTAETLIAELDRIFVEQFEVTADTVVPEARLREDLDLDSLDAADMMIAIEKRFGVRLDDQVARTFKTVGDIHGYVRKLVAEKLAAEAAASSHGEEQAAG
ncbi:MAG: phosphopantetheine-binding protein [Pseudomonadota bacterium]|nr:phosphopantetheine-binding protein [Pseudomonadota bacterium]